MLGYALMRVIKVSKCVLIEKKLSRDHFCFACQHRIFELVLKAAYEKTMIWKKAGPDVPLFKDFRNNLLLNVDVKNYK